MTRKRRREEGANANAHTGGRSRGPSLLSRGCRRLGCCSGASSLPLSLGGGCGGGGAASSSVRPSAHSSSGQKFKGAIVLPAATTAVSQ